MLHIETFSKNIFTNLAVELIHETNLAGSILPCVYYNADVSISIWMLSYVYRPAFRERFIEVFPILIRANGNPMIYVHCFAEILLKKYSPFKFLILCSFISEIFLLVSNLQNLKTRQFYIQQTSEALNDAFHRFIGKDLTNDELEDIQNEARKLSNGYGILEPFINKDGFIRQTADAILHESYGFENQQINAMMVRRPSQQTKSVKTSNNEFSSPSSPVGNISQTGVSILPVEELLTNYTAYNVQNQSNIIFSFGTIDQNREIWFLVQCSDHQDKIVTFENQPPEMDPSLPKTSQITDPSNSKSQAQENFLEKSSEEEWTVKETENGMGETCDATNVVISEEELMDGEAEFWEYFLAEDSENELEPSCQIVKEMENCGSENYIATNEIISEKELMNADEQFLKDKLSLLSITELMVDANGQFFYDLKAEDDYICQMFSKDENVSDPEGEAFSKEAIIDDPEDETFSKENILATGNALNIPGNLSFAFHHRESNAALQFLGENEEISSDENDAQPSNKIEINFQTDGNDTSTKKLHLNLDGGKFDLQFPANVTLIFKYNGSNVSSKQPEE